MHREKFDSQKVKIISFISFLIGFGQSLVAYILSSYFKEITGTENVGSFYVAAYAVVLVILLTWHKAIRRIGKAPVFLLSVLAKVGSVIALVLLPPSYVAIVALIAYIIFSALEWTSLDIILESYSQDNLSGRIRGVHLTILNAGFMFGPLVSTQVLSKYGFHGVFFILLIVNVFILVLSLIGLSKVNRGYNRDLKMIEIFQKVKKRKSIIRICYISLTLEIFYALMVIYTPFYLQDIGYSLNDIGWIFMIMLIPFVLLQIPVGYLADKKWGEKEMIVVSLLLMAFSTMLLLAVGQRTVAVWAGLLFFTRIGAAMLELLRDAYFYKRIDGYDVDMIDLFRSMIPLGYIIANLLVVPVLFFFPVKYVFFVIVIIVLSALYPASKLQDNQSECEREKVA